ncbi:putative hexose transport-related protein [Meredithblackwellia eburnea MCA 4105]
MGFKIVEDKDTPQEIYNFRIYATGVIISFSSCLFGYCSSFIGTAITGEAFKRDFGLAQLSAVERSNISANIVSVFQAGAFFGRTLQIIGLVFQISAILQIVATHQIGLIYAGRVIAGLTVGGVTCVAPVSVSVLHALSSLSLELIRPHSLCWVFRYLAELSPPAIRGRLVGFYEIAYQIAAVVGFWINYGIGKTIDPSLSKSWRIPFAVQLIPGGMLLFTSFYLKESPRFLLKMSNPEDAAKNLSFLRCLPVDHSYVEQELSATVVQINREKAVTDAHKGGKIERYFRGIWHEVSAKGIRNRLIIGAFIMMWQNMSGINSINYYSATLFADIGVQDTALYTGIYGVLKAIASLVFFAFLVDTWGRRPPLFMGGIMSGLSLLYIAVYLKIGHPGTEAVVSASTAAGGKGAIAFIMLFSIFYCMGWNGLAWVICAEVITLLLSISYTLEHALTLSLRMIRGFCAMWTALWQWVFQFIIARETPDMSRNLGWGMFLLFAVFNFASVVFVFFFIPETKGRTLEDMDVLFGAIRADEKPRSEEVRVEDTKGVRPLHDDAV